MEADAGENVVKELRSLSAGKGRRWLTAAALMGLGFAGTCGWIAWLGREFNPPSRCHGTVADGSLEYGRRLPYSGENFRAYSLLGYLGGRTFMHGTVRNVILAGYADLARQRPELRYLYAESGWPWGGRIRPHRSHANGTAVDFHVPLRAQDGAVTELPVSVFNQLGYGVSFDNSGRSGHLQIDFEAMALHLAALDQAARRQGISIRRVIFDGHLVPRLLATAAGARLAGRISFTGEAWIRHDQHYHVDFNVPCR